MNDAEPGTPGERDLGAQLRHFRVQLINRLLGAAAILVLLYTPVMVWRVLAVGWHPQLVVQTLFMLLGMACFTFRARLSLRLKSVLVTGVPYLLGLIGVFNQGMMGTGYWWTLIAVVLAATLHSIRAGALLAVGATTLLVFVAFGFTGGWLTPPVALNVFMASPSAWLGFIIVAVFAPLALLHAVGNYQSIIVRFAHEIEAQRRQLAAQLGHDQLTGLPQSALAMDRLERQLASARRHGHRVALLFIDLDGFKAINDDRGHTAGDLLLQTVAQRLRALLREADTVARIGGDEFLVILGELPDPGAAVQVAEKVILELAAPIGWHDHALQVGASVGIALFPDHAHDADALRREADAAMYDAKRQGRNRYRIAAPATRPLAA